MRCGKDIDHGERYGKLTVLRQTPSGKYLCGCACGHQWKVSARKLMRGTVKACGSCATSAKRGAGT